MRELLRGYAIAAAESAASSGDLARLEAELTEFDRVLIGSDLLRNSLSDPSIAARQRRGVVVDLLSGQALPLTASLVAWATLVEPAPELGAALSSLVELVAEAAAGAVEGLAVADSLASLPPAGRSAMRERISGFADRLFQEALQVTEIDAIEDDLFAISAVVAGHRGLRIALGDDSVPAPRRAAIVSELFEGKVGAQTVRLVEFVVRAGHVRDLVGTLEWLASLAASERGRRVADVRSAVDLDQGERARLAVALERTVGHPVEVRVSVDPEAIGGMVVSIGDTVIDGSIRHRLEQLREAFALPSNAGSRSKAPEPGESAA